MCYLHAVSYTHLDVYKRQPYLTGDTDTNRLKSEVNRRLRLHRLAETYITMDNAGAGLFQDEKPKVFSPQGYCGEAVEYPAFYSSREVKEMGIDATQIRSSRFTGVLLAPTGIFVTYNSGAALMKWRCKSEMRVKALMWSVPVSYTHLDVYKRQSLLLYQRAGEP